jgi:hypothetical protein
MFTRVSRPPHRNASIQARGDPRRPEAAAIARRTWTARAKGGTPRLAAGCRDGSGRPGCRSCADTGDCLPFSFDPPPALGGSRCGVTNRREAVVQSATETRCPKSRQSRVRKRRAAALTQVDLHRRGWPQMFVGQSRLPPSARRQCRRSRLPRPLPCRSRGQGSSAKSSRC